MQYFDTFLQWFQEWKIFKFKTELLWPHTNKHSKSSKQKSNEGHNSNIFKQEKYKLFNGVTLEFHKNGLNFCSTSFHFMLLTMLVNHFRLNPVVTSANSQATLSIFIELGTAALVSDVTQGPIFLYAVSHLKDLAVTICLTFM